MASGEAFVPRLRWASRAEFDEVLYKAHVARVGPFSVDHLVLCVAAGVDGISVYARSKVDGEQRTIRIAVRGEVEARDSATGVRSGLVSVEAALELAEYWAQRWQDGLER